MEITQFESFLKQKDLRLTQERLQLLEGVLAQKGHFSVETLLFNLRKGNFKVSRDTVYRNISLLIEAGVIRQSFRTGRDTLYEVASGREHHDHLICRICGKVVEFVNDEIEKLQMKVAEEFEFKLETHTHQLIGVCKKCL